MKRTLFPRIHSSAIVSLVAALLGLTSALPAGAQVDAPVGDELPSPVFEDGQAQVVEAFNDRDEWIRHDLWVETEFDSDGNGKPDRMHVSVTRQKQTDQGLKVPVVYNTSPYFAGTGGNGREYFWDTEHEIGELPEIHEKPEIAQQEKRPVISNGHTREWVPRGFAVVHSCSPGTGLSQGCVTIGGDNESLAPKAVVDWLCGRAKGYTTPDGDEEVTAFWCTGKVGMTGTSYNGTLPIACATTGVDGLEAIIPIAPNTSYYHYYRSFGLVRHPGGYMGEDADVLYDFVNSGDPEMREYCDCEIREKELLANIDRESGDYSEWWAGRDYMNDLEPYKTPTLMAHGLNDWNVMPGHTIRVYEALKSKGVPVMIYLHQGGHGGPPPMSMQNRWFTRYLYGLENGVEEDSRSWVVREGDRRSSPTEYDDYPNPEASLVELYPNEGGLQIGSLDFSRIEGGQGTETLIDDVGISGMRLAAKDESENRLLYATPELKEPVHISGTPNITLRVASDKEAVNLSVWVVSLPIVNSRQINDNLITRGWADPQNHESQTDGEPMVPGEFYDVDFTLQPDDQIIPAGQRIGLMVFSSDRDFTLWPDPGTKLMLDLSGSSIELPVVGGEEALREALGQTVE
ncbi:MAG: Xaa-Pro dipeptidyl-peptidase [Planctomycetota bacterium]